jgi:hypothetical protein
MMHLLSSDEEPVSQIRLDSGFVNQTHRRQVLELEIHASAVEVFPFDVAFVGDLSLGWLA